MVRAIVAGTKTQTRRVVKPQPVEIVDGIPYRNVFEGDGFRSERRIVGKKVHRSPYGQPSDRLWVRETFYCAAPDYSDGYPVHYRASTDIVTDVSVKWKPSIFMPRWASRITLEVTGVRVDRLQEIREADVIAEGLDSVVQNEIQMRIGHTLSPQQCYFTLWESINAKRAPWSLNPYVWVVEFKRV